MIIKISNGTLVLETSVSKGQNVYTENGIIAAITDKDLPYDIEINAEGMYISPGFIDLHVHGAVGGDFSNGSVAENLSAANYHCLHSTTSLFPTTLSASFEQTDAALAALRQTMESGALMPNICGIHLEGPYFSKNQCGAQNPNHITSPIKEDYERLLAMYGDLIKRWSFAPELDGTDTFLEMLHTYGVVPSIGHSDAQYEDVMAVDRNGCKLITHFYSCISTITREKGFSKLGITECGYLLDDMMVEAIADGCHIPKDLFRLLMKIKGSDSICLVTDATCGCGVETGEFSLGGIPCKIKNDVAYLLNESAFAGSIATTDRLLRFCVNEVGLDLCEAIKMMTVVPAKIMGLSSKGTVKVGYDADLLFLDDHLNIRQVMVGGNMVCV